MIHLWSTWNFSWFCASYYGLLPFNAPLKSSLLATSLIGGYTVYVYPRKLKIKILNYKFYMPYFLLVAGDLIIHQFPFFYTLMKKKDNEDNLCGTLVMLPISAWFGINYALNNDYDKLYGIKMKYLVTSSLLLFGSHSLCYHVIRKLLKN